MDSPLAAALALLAGTIAGAVTGRASAESVREAVAGLGAALRSEVAEQIADVRRDLGALGDYVRSSDEEREAARSRRPKAPPVKLDALAELDRRVVTCELRGVQEETRVDEALRRIAELERR